MFDGSRDYLYFDSATLVFQDLIIPSCGQCLAATEEFGKRIVVKIEPNPSEIQFQAISEIISHEFWHYWLWVKTFDRYFANNGVHWFLNNGAKPETRVIKSIVFLRLFKFTLTIQFYKPFGALAAREFIQKRIAAGLDKGKHDYW